MFDIKQWARRTTENRAFELAITCVIIANSILIGVETYTNNETLQLTQTIILGIFTVEIALRFIASKGILSFFSDGWNVFDFLLVLIGFVPESLASNASAMMALRVLRVFRILRLLRSAKEIKLIVNVLIKSMSAMFYNLILFLIFVYLYAIAGVSMFRMPEPETLSAEERVNYEKYLEIAPHTPMNSPDPFGTLGEAIFTLFRELTGEDWTDLRYNHITACKYGVLKINPTVVTVYHVSWYCLAAFLLLNLVTGSIINNYMIAIEKQEKKKKCFDKIKKTQ